jgi:hypothetical protein
MTTPNVTVNVASKGYGVRTSSSISVVNIGDRKTMPRPTIHDVAQAAGVSAMSVSRVLNGRPGVGAQTARRIEEAVRSLGYRPNKLAANFRQQRGVSLPRSRWPLASSCATTG